MLMHQITHNNHFVPRFYLRQWSDDGVHIWAYRILVSHSAVPEWCNRPISGLAYKRDLYTQQVDGMEVDDFEKWIEAEFESPVQDSLRKVLNDDSLSASDWDLLAMFLAAQDVRTPSSYLESMERWEKTLPGLLQDTLEESVHYLERIQGTDEMVKASKLEEQFSTSVMSVQAFPSSESDSDHGCIRAEIVAGRALWLDIQKHLLMNTAKELTKHKWSIVQPAEGHQWFTCDHPVVKLNYYGEDRYDLKGGWGKKGTNIFMPLSPRHLLFTQIGDEFSDRFTLTAEQTRKLQRFIAERAFRWIFASQQLETVINLRPRYVDSEALDRELEQWKEWHRQQSEAEN